MEVHSWYLPAVTIISLRYCVISIEMWISRLPPLRCEYWGISQADNLHLQFLSVGSDHVLGWARAPLLADISLDTHSNIASRPNWYDSSQLNQKICTILHLKKSTPFQFFQIVQPYSIFWSISTKDGIVQLANDFRRSEQISQHHNHHGSELNLKPKLIRWKLLPCWKNRLQFPLRWNCIPSARIAFGVFFSSTRACYCCWTRKDSSDYHFFPFSKAISKRSKAMRGFVSFGDFRFILMRFACDWKASNCQITRAIALRRVSINCNWTAWHSRCDVIRMWKRCTSSDLCRWWFFQYLPIYVVRGLICNTISQSIVVKPSTMIAINILSYRGNLCKNQWIHPQHPSSIVTMQNTNIRPILHCGTAWLSDLRSSKEFIYHSTPAPLSRKSESPSLWFGSSEDGLC